ncbi:methylated-DNA--[protein]-cysteine S-methyltransferase [Aureibacter tunicatorum]|uniref:Methylated-DNA--protein-cysteine methyltransferase n=1 Tax=Aureibacter tunicatorum TaxID=866807 RepID=A0AAE3XLH3_9BACT|nr:methylated-DNA--[protein]-cysteine S-methyltransferase [Aureibacter tunicatorum]MDR6238125.1 O-6-methylguanine DNA methyltransferase [Aureibacter tunicatorum]BDD03158.1 hypothetical protein AUTU_06410 [Aureibacter tunicatorum]
MMYYEVFEISGYRVTLIGDEQGLSRLMIGEEVEYSLKGLQEVCGFDLFEQAKIQLAEYFIGSRIDFDLKLNPQGTDFQKSVWNALREIPYGEARTYKQIAVEVGNPKGARAVGMANNKNPLPVIIPCHRVVGTGNKLTGYVFGLTMKRHLLNLEKVTVIFRRLEAGNARHGKVWWPSDSVFEIMVGAILTQNTTWKNVEKSLSELSDYLIPSKILSFSQEELALKIKSSGYQNQKALYLKTMAEWWMSKGESIECLKGLSDNEFRTELLSLKGVGKETADSIMVYAFSRPFFVIDAYTRRIFQRVGFEVPKDYDEFRIMIEECVSRDSRLYGEYHGLLVEHAKNYCLSIPKCEKCPLAEICDYKVEETLSLFG